MKDGPTSASSPIGALTTASLNEIFYCHLNCGQQQSLAFGRRLARPSDRTRALRMQRVRATPTASNDRTSAQKSKKCWRMYQADDGGETGTALAKIALNDRLQY